MHLAARLSVLGSVLIPAVIAGFNAEASSNVAAYWGQNSFGEGAGPLAQQPLSHYCANSDIDILPLGFLLGIKTPRLNFANQEAGCQPIAGSSLIYCPTLEEDIKICQSRYGKKILLSLGGDTYNEGGFSSPAEAIENANKVWAMFGPSSLAAGPRPFGTAVIDGFDFDFESQADNLTPFAQRLRQLADESSKPFMLTAAPQCPYPDAAVGQMLASTVPMDAVFVQYYNNECGVASFVEGAEVQPKLNLEAWETWAKTVSANPNVRVMIGVPGNVEAGAGYVSADKLKAVLDYAKGFSSFGGVMVWDVSQAYSNDGFLSTIRSALGTSTALISAPATPSPAIEDAVVEEPAKQDPTPAPAKPDQIVQIPELVMPTPVSPAKILVQEWNQCGGIDYTGPTECEAGLICTRGGSEWWYSCKKHGSPWKA